MLFNSTKKQDKMRKLPRKSPFQSSVQYKHKQFAYLLPVGCLLKEEATRQQQGKNKQEKHSLINKTLLESHFLCLWVKFPTHLNLFIPVECVLSITWSLSHSPCSASLSEHLNDTQRQQIVSSIVIPLSVLASN